MSKVAILIDGGFLIKRLPAFYDKVIVHDPVKVDQIIGRLVYRHLANLNKVLCVENHWSLLYRCFYYDAKPYTDRGHLPVSKRAIDYAKSDEAKFRLDLFERLRKRPSFAVRLGEVHREQAWILKEPTLKALLSGQKAVADLTDSDFTPGFRQKAVDMRIGIDIASISLKQQVDTIILVAGDRDFVPAAKLARREGIKIILDPLWQNVSGDLFEHIDGLRSALPKPQKTKPKTLDEQEPR